MAGKRRRTTTAGLRPVAIKKRRAAYKQKFTLSRNTLPDCTKIILKYCDRFQVAPISGAVWVQTFRGNSLYDPDYTTTGHQPAGFDEISALYKWYTVHASSIKVDLVPGATGVGVASAEVAVIPTVNATDWTAVEPEVIRENQYGKMMIVSNGNGMPSMNHYMTTSKMLGRSDINQQTTGALVSANPEEGWFWHVVIQAVDEATTLDMYLYCTVVYYAEFSQRNKLLQS